LAQLRRGDEIARLAELGLARAVVTQPGRIQATLHVLRERHRPVRGDLLAQLAQQVIGMLAFVGGGFGETGGHAGVSSLAKEASITDDPQWLRACRETGPSSQPSPRSSKLRPSMAAPRCPEGGRRSRSEVLLQAEVQAAARTELRRTHADAGAVAQLVGAIQ